MNQSWVMIKRQCWRELRVGIRAPRQFVYACLFFILVVLFFPLTISAEASTLKSVAPGLIWIDLLFALFLACERLLQQDYDEGVIEQWLVSGASITGLVTIKILVNWLFTLVPLLLLCPILTLLLHLNVYEMLALSASLACGSLAIMLVCALATAFTTGLKQQGLMMALILFPLTIPVMIFGSSTLVAAMQGLPVTGYLALLLALSLLALLLLPWAIAAVIRINLAE